MATFMLNLCHFCFLVLRSAILTHYKFILNCMDMTINLGAVIASALAYMFIGMLWYGPLFGKPWMKLMNIDPSSMDKKDKEKGRAVMNAYMISFFSSMLIAYVFDVLLAYLGVTTAIGGLSAAILIFIGFVALPNITDILFGGKPVKLYLIDNGYKLAYLIAIGVIVALI
jgi:hypothetical protein